MSKQRLLFITTGGTIASVRTAQGLKPVLTSEELLAHLPELQQLCCPETLNLCSIDSTDLGPEHWLMMAKAVQENYALYDGFIICHGTDTLAYSAAALSYLIQNADKPIILTGAQQPISNEITDAKKNLRDSVICALDPGSRGVMVVFGGHVIAGTRAKKNKTISYDAFVGTEYGLSKFDGYRFTNYLHNEEDTTSITDNIISDLLVDKKGNLWIGCAKGLMRYNYETNDFARLQFPDGRKPRIYSMVESHNGDILLGTAGYGLYSVKDRNTRKGTDHLFAIRQERQYAERDSDVFFTHIYEDKHHYLWQSRHTWRRG